MQHLTDYYILYLLLICRIFLKYGTGNVMNNTAERKMGRHSASVRGMGGRNVIETDRDDGYSGI